MDEPAKKPPAPAKATPATATNLRPKGAVITKAGRGKGKDGARQARRMGHGLMGLPARAAAPAAGGTASAAPPRAPAAPGPSTWATGTAQKEKEKAGGAAPAAAAAADADDGFTGTFARDLPAMMYGFGDDPSPLQETVEVVEAALLQYLGSVAQRAAAVASSSLKAKVDERDVLFVVRKDPAKFARIKELLMMQQVIQDARAIDKDARTVLQP